MRLNDELADKNELRALSKQFPLTDKEGSE